MPGLFTTGDLVPSASNHLGSSITAVRQIGMFAGVDLEFKERYILNTQMRRDGSSLFGSANQWANYGRGSFAWRASEEPFWPFKNTINDFKLRAAVGQAGNRPSFSQQYQTFNISNGAVSATTLGNENLQARAVDGSRAGLRRGDPAQVRPHGHACARHRVERAAERAAAGGDGLHEPVEERRPAGQCDVGSVR